jgi:hypothetical protein
MANSAKEILISVAVNQHDKHQRDAWLRKKYGTKPRGLLLRLDHAACMYASALKSPPAPLYKRGEFDFLVRTKTFRLNASGHRQAKESVENRFFRLKAVRGSSA